MPERTTIVLPTSMKQRAHARARARGISFAEFVREALRNEMAAAPKKNRKRSKDPLFGKVPVYDGPIPADFSVNHDKYLYDEP